MNSMTHRKTILVVDDQEIVLDYAASLLTAAGYHVMTACAPELALLVAERYNGAIHLLLTDYQMPGVNGIELAKTLIAKRPGLGVIMMSGCDPAEVPLNPTWTFLPKPFRSADLLQLVAARLNAKTTLPERVPVARELDSPSSCDRKIG